MSGGDYFRDNQGRLLLHLVGMLLLPAFLLLTGTAGGVVLLILIVWVTSLLIGSVVDFLRRKKSLEELWNILEGLPEKYLFMECIPKATSEYEKQWYQIMAVASRSMAGEVASAQRQQKEYREYIENWVHEIKVPITTTQLICENNKNEVSRKILVQLAHVEEQVERALYYARSEQMDRDFIIRSTRLSDVVDGALAKYRTLLIASGARVETDGLENWIYTDGKWLEFIIGQMLSNAIKYQGKQPVINITAKANEKETVLCVKDNGIGIPSAELPRIFDKGFTGSNGRVRGGATGIGLYLCQKLTLHLGGTLTAESVLGEYTSLTLHFPSSGEGTT